jgi:hypothetical protein
MTKTVTDQIVAALALFEAKGVRGSEGEVVSRVVLDLRSFDPNSRLGFGL